MKKNLLLKLCIIPVVIATDIITKIVLWGKNYPFLKGFISIHSVDLNEGAAWNILDGHTWVLILISLIFLVFLVLFDLKYKSDSILYNIGFSMIVGGAVGNLIDRIFLGGVRDFLLFDFWTDFPVFNMADAFLCVGVVLFAIYLIFFFSDKPKEGK